MSTVSPPASTAEAREMLRAALGFLHANAAEMVTEEQAECLQALEQADSMSTATRALVLGSFISSRGYCADADYSPRSWLIHRTRITKGAATARTAWVRRAAAHPLVAAALAEGYACRSYATEAVRVDGQAARGMPGRRRRDPGRRRPGGRDQQDLVELAMEIMPGPVLLIPARTPTTASRTGRYGSRPPSAAQASSPAT